MAVSETLAVEPFHKWMAKIFFSGTSTEGEVTLSSSALQQQRSVGTELLQSSIRDGALQDRGLTSLTASMVDTTDVETAKVVRGLMTCISYEVSSKSLS